MVSAVDLDLGRRRRRRVRALERKLSERDDDERADGGLSVRGVSFVRGDKRGAPKKGGGRPSIVLSSRERREKEKSVLLGK